MRQSHDLRKYGVRCGHVNTFQSLDTDIRWTVGRLRLWCEQFLIIHWNVWQINKNVPKLGYFFVHSCTRNGVLLFWVVSDYCSSCSAPYAICQMLLVVFSCVSQLKLCRRCGNLWEMWKVSKNCWTLVDNPRHRRQQLIKCRSLCCPSTCSFYDERIRSSGDCTLKKKTHRRREKAANVSLSLPYSQKRSLIRRSIA